MLRKLHEFTLPKGFTDEQGKLHKTGTMRLATATDMIMPPKDAQARQNPTYRKNIILSRVITKLGTLPSVTPKTVESLFAADLAYLEEFYNSINGEENTNLQTVCPKCKKEFSVEPESTGE
jgi:hypothetical protein